MRYRRPAAGLHTELFVKFSRDFDDPIRDRGRTQMEQEVRLAALALSEDFPIPVPRPQFGDYHRESGTGILIAERIVSAPTESNRSTRSAWTTGCPTLSATTGPC